MSSDYINNKNLLEFEDVYEDLMLIAIQTRPESIQNSRLYGPINRGYWECKNS